jgi:hypothetical protein
MQHDALQLDCMSCIIAAVHMRLMAAAVAALRQVAVWLRQLHKMLNSWVECFRVG